MARSYILYNELHYNSLMTDWGLCKEMDGTSLKLQRKQK